MQTRLRLFSLLLCYVVAGYGREVNLMPLLGYDAPQPSSNPNKLPGDTPTPASSGVASVRSLVDHHLKASDNFTLRIQFVLSNCLKTVTRFQLYPTHPDGARRVIVGVEIFPYRHQILIKFRIGNRARVETFYYDLTPGVTSELSVAFVEDQLLLYVNCSRIYSRRVGAVDRLVADAGQYEAIFRSKGKCSTKLLAAYLLFNSEFVEALPQCVDATCTVSNRLDVNQLLQDLNEAENELHQLSNQVSYLNRSLVKWEGCECARYCTVGDTRLANGTVWKDGPKDCECVNGEVVCACRKLNCAGDQNQYLAPGQQCSTCGNKCDVSGKLYRHGDPMNDGQHNCTCLNGEFVDCRVINAVNPNIQGEAPLPTVDSTPSRTPSGCSRCCSDQGCRDNQGYCVCECSGSKCKRCGIAGKVAQFVHPRTGKCTRYVNLLFSDIDYYNNVLRNLYPY